MTIWLSGNYLMELQRACGAFLQSEGYNEEKRKAIDSFGYFIVFGRWIALFNTIEEQYLWITFGIRIDINANDLESHVQCTRIEIIFTIWSRTFFTFTNGQFQQYVWLAGWLNQSIIIFRQKSIPDDVNNEPNGSIPLRFNHFKLHCASNFHQ